MSDDFTRQFAIRLPNGELFSTPEVGGWYASLLGVSPRPQRVVVYDSREEAETALQAMQEKGAQMGITLVASIESRLCSPFSQTDPGEQFVDELTKWAERQGEL